MINLGADAISKALASAGSPTGQTAYQAINPLSGLSSQMMALKGQSPHGLDVASAFIKNLTGMGGPEDFVNTSRWINEAFGNR